MRHRLDQRANRLPVVLMTLAACLALVAPLSTSGPAHASVPPTSTSIQCSATVTSQTQSAGVVRMTGQVVCANSKGVFRELRVKPVIDRSGGGQAHRTFYGSVKSCASTTGVTSCSTTFSGSSQMRV